MKDYADIARRYAEGVVAGLIPAGQLAVAACARHLADLERAKAGWDFYFDADDAAHLCAFVEALPHIKGDLAQTNSLLRLEPWQVFILASLNGWRRRIDGGRRFRIAYVEVPRKNGKSTLIAPVLLFLLTADGEAGAEVYTAATKMEQARIVFDLACAMARKTPNLISEAGLIVQRHRIRRVGDEGTMRPLEAKKLDGLNPHGAGIDELHEHRDRTVWDALADALGARSNPLMVAITTAGEDLAHVCYEQHDYAAKVLNRVLVDETYFSIVFAAGEADDPMDPATWARANPNLGVSKSPAYMASTADQSKAVPSRWGEYLRKHLGLWTREGATAIDLSGWRRGIDPSLRREQFHGAGGLIGMDLALRDDMAAIVYLHEDPDGGVTLFADHFATEQSLNLPGREGVRGWGERGLIEVHQGAMMDLGRIRAVASARAAQFGTRELAIDPYLGGQMMQELSDEGLPVVELRQTPMNLSAGFERLIALASDGKVRTDGDPVLMWQASNVVARKRGEFSVPDKQAPAQKIDGVQAAVTAMARLAAPDEAAPLVTAFPDDYRIAL